MSEGDPRRTSIKLPKSDARRADEPDAHRTSAQPGTAGAAPRRRPELDTASDLDRRRDRIEAADILRDRRVAVRS